MLFAIHKIHNDASVFYATDVGTFIEDYVEVTPTLFAIQEEAQALADYLKAHQIPCTVVPYHGS